MAATSNGRLDTDSHLPSVETLKSNLRAFCSRWNSTTSTHITVSTLVSVGEYIDHAEDLLVYRGGNQAKETTLSRDLILSLLVAAWTRPELAPSFKQRIK